MRSRSTILPPRLASRARWLAPGLAAWLGACSPASYAVEADDQVYGILESASRGVTGKSKTFPVGRVEGTLREQLLADDRELFLDLTTALDVAAENSRDYQRQKETLYLAALDLTRQQHDFALRFGGGGTAEVSGVGDDEVDVSFSDDLSAAVNTVSGTRIVASFVNTFLRSLVHGGGFDASSILSLAITQPLLRASGRRIVREPLTQAERDVVYAVRDFERFRAVFAVDVISEYLTVVRQYQDIESVRANLRSVQQAREQSEALYEGGRVTIIDVDRAKQDELTARDRLVTTQNRLDAALDRFKLTLGLPTDANITLDVGSLDQIEQRGVDRVEIEEDSAIEIALERRYDHRTALDLVDDAARRVLVAEDALRNQLDFSAVVDVPTEPDQPLKFDWSRVSWAAGFDLQLALDKLVERNAYRAALINVDAAMRAREQSADNVKLDVRNALRNIQTTIQNYQIQTSAVRIAEQRADSTRELYLADRADANDVLDAENSLLNARIQLTAAIVDYSIARLELLRDLEALAIEPKGLRLDLALPLPTAAD